MRKKLFSRSMALVLSLALLAVPAQALTLEQAAELLQNLYIDEVPAQALEKETIQEMVEAIGDPYTQYFTPEEYEAFLATMSDTRLVGVGVVLSYPADGLVPQEGLFLDQVLDNAPAAKGGLVTGDVILTVDGRPVGGETLDNVAQWLRGEVGTEVTVTFLHEGQEFSATLIRENVVVAATTTELLDGHIGYIKCTTFGGETAGHFREGLDTYDTEADLWVVDLRSNTGGAADAATESVGYFTGPGYMSFLRDGKDSYSAFFHQDEVVTEDPVIVLTSPYTASSSEIFASAVQSYSAGLVIGDRTYGKGVAQIVADQTTQPELFPNGDALKVTAYRFFSPAGNTTDKVGVVPDLLVDPERALGVAALLEPQLDENPDRIKGTTLRLFLGGWQWYIDLVKASDEAHREDFQCLIDALPLNIDIEVENETSGEWETAELADLCVKYGMEYRPALFDDMLDSSSPEALSILKTYDIIRGRGDGKYYPLDGMTRAEFCQILYSALNLTASADPSLYTDVTEEYWFAPAVTALTEMGLFEGEGDGLFHPYKIVDRQQLFTVMGRLSQFLNFGFYDAAHDIPEGILELERYAAYPDWARLPVWLLADSQSNALGQTVSLLWAEPQDIDPSAPATRDEAAQLLFNLLSYTDILPY